MYRNLRSFSTFCPNLYSVPKIAHRWKRSRGHSQKRSYLGEYIIGMKVGPFVSYIKWLGELGSVDCVFIACSVPFVCLIPQGHFFPKWYASYFPWNLSFFLLARVCYTADCNVLTLRRSSCNSTLPLFVQQTKGGPYLNLNLASKRCLYHHTKQPAEIKAPWTTIDRSLNM